MRSFYATAAFAAAASAQYELQSTFAGETFFDNFVFFNSWGFVQYVTKEAAEGFGMINVTKTSASWGVDATSLFDPTAPLGRPSFRITSVQSWTHGLFIADLAHVPANVCGTWPAFWALGSGTWPDNGEIDIIEYTNNVPNNLMALHTTPGCSIAGAGETGTLVAADCGINGGITGCTVVTDTPNNSGDAFNAIGGGVSEGVPVVEEFGLPAANFQGSCILDGHFFNMSLVFNIDFCGQYAGNVWQANGCPMLNPEDGWASCNMFVANSPQSFVESYWEVNYLKIFQTMTAAISSSTSSMSSVTPAVSAGASSTALSNAQGRTSTATMSLAPTIPSIAPESSTTLSLASSVLSSLSSQNVPSTASSPSTPGTEPVLTTSPSTLSPATSSGITTVSTIPAATPTSATPTTQAPAPSLSCSGYVCIAYTSVVIVETVTVNALQTVLQ
ncbi:hypothetical protein LTR09_007104 [Extremus antarcticus]|uniref:GH16 domain-containing protein n=1 Tax=Extremus antarcticus TaxID=702011 RepID=A0AAJ0DDB8_9PEZI|nr:hypothetical protein LTR09_007104 [Extremus antarcticus]